MIYARPSHRRWGWFATACAIGILGAGCAGLFSLGSDRDTQGATAGTGTLRVLVTDKPYPYEYVESAIVTLTRVDVRSAKNSPGPCSQAVCQSGACTLTDVDCDDGDPCTLDSCDPDSGACLHEDITCTAGEACSEGVCAATCAQNDDCDDANGCTTDACLNGTCVHAANVCDDDNPCTLNDCNEFSGACTFPSLDCPPDEVCVAGDCVAFCTENSECDDGSACTSDVCVEGFCVLQPVDCDDADDCTQDVCNPLSGECVHTAKECDDDEVCRNAVCYPPCTEDADCAALDATGADDGDPWVTIFEGEKSFDLVELQGGRTDLLADAVIEAGTYTQMRLFVTEGVIALTDRRVFPIKVPSGASSGIKLQFTFNVPEDEAATLLLDIDMSRAFTPVPGGQVDSASGIERFSFSPALALRLINITAAGSISGQVTSAEDGNPVAAASVTAYEGEKEITSTSTAADGTYVLSGLPAGTYRVEFSASGFDGVELESDVTAAQSTTGVDAVLEAP